ISPSRCNRTSSSPSSTGSCATARRVRRFRRARRPPPGRHPKRRETTGKRPKSTKNRKNRKNRKMARILLVDDPPGAALAAVEALGIDLALAQTRGRHQIDTVASVVEARRRSAAERYDLVLLHPERLTGGPDGDEVLRETFDVFEDGLCLVSPQGALEIANARGARLYRGPMQSELREAAGEAITRGAAADRGMSQEGRAFVVRAFPLPGRGAILYVRDATDERERELGRLQAEKLASIGLLAAGVAHEINNPAAFVLANIDALGGHLRL